MTYRVKFSAPGYEVVALILDYVFVTKAAALDIADKINANNKDVLAWVVEEGNE